MSKYQFQTAGQGIINIRKPDGVSAPHVATASRGVAGEWSVYRVSYATGGPRQVGEPIQVERAGAIHDEASLSELVDQLLEGAK